MKRIGMLGVSMVGLAMAVSACGSSDDNANHASPAASGSASASTSASASPAAGGEPVTIKVFQLKVEIADKFEAMVKEFEAANPNIKVEAETVGGGTGYMDALKAKFAAGEGPDIFNNGGAKEMQLWKEHLADLSDQPWVSHLLPGTGDGMKDADGKLYGMPMNMEGYGYLYNKDLFAKAGITELPTTLTGLQAAAQKLKDAGITPFANGFSEWWIIGSHFTNVAFGQQADPAGFIQQLNDGAATIPSNEIFKQFQNLMDTTIKYSNDNPLTTDYNTQVTLFASGKAAMLQQGNWVESMIGDIDPNLNVGILPMPVNDEAGSDRIVAGVPNNWAVNKDSAHVDAAKSFLDWMVSSEAGQRYMTEQFGFIPAFDNIPTDKLSPLSQDIVAFSKAGKAIPMIWTSWPDGANKEFAAALQEYAAGKIKWDEVLNKMQESWNILK
ncbi:ABC transporter substrate-binding protein [Cohnella rhizoplanae]|uniref:ABC transporter substrate-binding protein n=1 Tax=Cohnella rhizoplanae TaxID=2974897 RepID=UPI0022FF860C|nr:extracellular solute-binding protein [Cohnella sp. JJ-181]CAI6075635.1 Multiple sugar-binding protein [Cohnella sp. JJ-181]